MDVLGEVKSHVVMRNMSECISYKIVKFTAPLGLNLFLLEKASLYYTGVEFLCFSASNKSYELWIISTISMFQLSFSPNDWDFLK